MQINGKEYDGYVPRCSFGEFGDYIRMSFCLDCGQIQGEFPDRSVLDDEEVIKQFEEQEDI